MEPGSWRDWLSSELPGGGVILDEHAADRNTNHPLLAAGQKLQLVRPTTQRVWDRGVFCHLALQHAQPLTSGLLGRAAHCRLAGTDIAPL